MLSDFGELIKIHLIILKPSCNKNCKKYVAIPASDLTICAKCGHEKECPPCPRPQRCPEPAFTCKKVPNYSAANVDSILPSTMDGTGAGAGDGKPIPVLNSFASFS